MQWAPQSTRKVGKCSTSRSFSFSTFVASLIKSREEHLLRCCRWKTKSIEVRTGHACKRMYSTSTRKQSICYKREFRKGTIETYIRIILKIPSKDRRVGFIRRKSKSAKFISPVFAEFYRAGRPSSELHQGTIEADEIPGYDLWAEIYFLVNHQG